MQRRSILVSVFLLLIFVADHARAEWVLNGTLVGGQATSYAADAVSDGAGGAIIVWIELRASDYDIYARRIDAAGNPLWTSGGVAVCTAPSDQTDLAAVSDGAGGVIIAWRDDRGADQDIYVQRVISAGVAAWTANGVALCTATDTQASARLVSDGAGGAIVTWQDARSGTNWDIYARRVNFAGVPQWAANGVAVCTQAAGQTAPRPVADGSGGVIMGWGDARNASIDIYAQRLNASGAPQWTVNGIPVCAATGNQGVLAAASDGAGGAVFAWDDERNGFKDIFAQRLNGAGAAQWLPDGAPVCAAADEQGETKIIGDGSGGAIVAWVDYRNGADLNIYAQRISAFGTPLWAYDGLPLCTVPGQQNTISLASDDAGGVIAAWQDSRSGTTVDVYARRVLATGTPTWEYDGAPLVTGTGNSNLHAVADGTGGIIAVSTDYRSGTSLVYAQRAEPRYGYWGRPEPTIRPAIDNPADQGGKVIVRWTASQRDLYYMPAISHYSVWRATDDVAFTAAAAAGRKTAVRDPRAVTRDHRGPALWMEETAAGPVYWEWVANLDATYQPSYSYTAPTRQDSTVTDPATTYFKVLSHEYTTPQGRVWESASTSARSVDNLAPAAPLLLAIRESGSNAVLTWKPVEEADFAHYTLYRADASGVRVLADNFLIDATLPNHTDIGAAPDGFYYIVTAVDIHGNESTPSNEVSLSGATDIGDTPAITVLTLQPNSPNPFSTRTELNVGVSETGNATVEIFDIGGRRVLERNLGGLEKGWRRVAFDAVDDRGQPLASGVYLCRIRMNGQRATGKMVIAR